ncbi:hypothetical protein N9A45_00340 [bacterium]|nr:hypothetical protein [bacterium]
MCALLWSTNRIRRCCSHRREKPLSRRRNWRIDRDTTDNVTGTKSETHDCHMCRDAFKKELAFSGRYDSSKAVDTLCRENYITL